MAESNLCPTAEVVSEIISKLKTLEKKQAAFVKAKSKALSTRITKGIDEACATVKGLIKEIAGYDCPEGIGSKLKEFELRPLTEKLHKAACARDLPINELQRLLDTFLPEIESTKTSTDNEYQLGEIRAILSSELKIKERYPYDPVKSKQEQYSALADIKKSQGGYWSKHILRLISEIQTLLYTYWDYFKANDLWEKIPTISRIMKLIKTGRPLDLEYIMQGLKDVECKMKIKEKQPAHKSLEQALPKDPAADPSPQKRTEIKINVNFSKGRSRELIEGLIINPDGIPGTLQDTKNLKRVLKDYPDIAEDIHKKPNKNIIYLKNIRLKEEKNRT